MKNSDPESSAPTKENPQNPPKNIYPDRKSMSVRLGKTLHKKLMRQTRRMQISANQYITKLIEADLERRQAVIDQERETRQAELAKEKR